MAKGVKWPIAASVACAAALALLAAVVFGLDGVQRLDSQLLGKLMTPTGDAAGPIVNTVARFADPLYLALLLALACGIALQRARTIDAVAAVTVVVGANVTTQVLKGLLTHPRIQPHLVNNEILPTNMFPSGHATAAASIAIAFAFVVSSEWRPAVATLGFFYVAAVDICVLILAWHFPSDVLAGTLVACGWGFAVLAGRRYLEARSAERSLNRPAAPPAPRSNPPSPDWQGIRG